MEKNQNQKKQKTGDRNLKARGLWLCILLSPTEQLYDFPKTLYYQQLL